MTERNTLLVTLKIPVTVYASEGVEAATDPGAWHAALNESTWREGRYAFEQELVDEGLSREFKRAIGHAQGRRLEARHGDASISSRDCDVSITQPAWRLALTDWWNSFFHGIQLRRDLMDVQVERTTHPHESL